ncbi:prepilin-type N-terminal cleavage/methylation domain-containing protein [Pontiella agarivorans]|uniref:Prepilin-type N-terminal cleavage/methylation domain-containing protein n=1 Tax=Pontiella agarivorans TaxID=3038953 RepID=A0ABU5MUU9_9BACT|nr:prepilin-type N-terminal cleavage/methylation domain-containing protein [Pontiella agarivorans]MDZ8117871.1 prepilin-type N-terminal cleavage/methylation domain-containing protein [Pontiella agarivorans]
MRNPPFQSKSAFTLAELLVVIMIIGIMSAITLPMLSGITGQSRLEAATNALHSAAKLARQHAVTHKEPAYLIFHDDITDPELAYRSYAVFAIDISSPPVTQDDGYFVKDWERLPEGILIDPDANPSENLFEIGNDPWDGALNKNNELKIDGTTYITLGFKPTGEIAAASHHIHLAAGTVINGRPEIFNPCPGKQIHFTTFGKSLILDTVYGENDGDFQLLGETAE